MHRYVGREVGREERLAPMPATPDIHRPRQYDGRDPCPKAPTSEYERIGSPPDLGVRLRDNVLRVARIPHNSTREPVRHSLTVELFLSHSTFYTPYDVARDGNRFQSYRISAR